jgi:uncharacterized MnhB-related membrane protein
LNRAHWCGCFICTDRELIETVRATGSIEVGAVELYLATDASDVALAEVKSPPVRALLR